MSSVVIFNAIGDMSSVIIHNAIRDLFKHKIVRCMSIVSLIPNAVQKSCLYRHSSYLLNHRMIMKYMSIKCCNKSYTITFTSYFP